MLTIRKLIEQLELLESEDSNYKVRDKGNCISFEIERKYPAKGEIKADIKARYKKFKDAEISFNWLKIPTKEYLGNGVTKLVYAEYSGTFNHFGVLKPIGGEIYKERTV